MCSFYLIFIDLRHILNNELRDKVTEGAMAVSYSVEIGGPICQISFNQQAILINLIGIVNLHALPSAIGVPLLYLLFLFGFLRHG
jgi:hypothetical protein